MFNTNTNADNVTDKIMSNNNQSSVEWLVEKLGKYNEEMIFLYQNEIQEAKAMHKEEIMQAHYAPKYGCFSEQYYNETFGGEE